MTEENKTQSASKVNDFCITFCTVNGSGSATANNLLFRCFFRMGIPVSGKNIFPSNIQGLPTWYTIRLSKKGYMGRVEQDDIVVALNPTTFTKDITYLVPGGVLLYADDIKIPIERSDIVAYPMPVKKLAREAEVPSNMRDYIANMVYVGVMAQVLGMNLDVVYETVNFQFKGKKKAVDSNFAVIKAAYDWAAANLTKTDVYRVEPMDGNKDCIMADGNTAGALGAIYGGVQFSGWYPITPATSLPESLNELIPALRKDPVTGKDTCIMVQAEDELAAIGMTIGAGWAGLRAMTATSGPGLSLMAEYLGLAYYTEVPVVVWDVQRVGPSTGLPTRTAQGDLTETYFLSHGDTQFIILIPGSVNECFEMGWQAFDIAERIQTPVIVMSDLDFGMNNWVTKKFEYPDRPMDRGKVLWEEDLEKRVNEWGRYLDLDGDGIPYRTLMGNQHPKSAYFARGTGHDEFARYNEDQVVWERVLARIKKKFETAKAYIPKPEIQTLEDAKIGIIAMGSADSAVLEARDLMAEAGLKVNTMRVRSIPFTQEVTDFIAANERCYVVELNRDGQLHQLLSLNHPAYATRLISVAHMDGMPLSARWIKAEITAREEK